VEKLANHGVKLQKVTLWGKLNANQRTKVNPKHHVHLPTCQKQIHHAKEKGGSVLEKKTA